MNKAVFLDRDGVINPLIYYADTGKYESPRSLEEFEIYPYVLSSLRLIKQSGYLIFVVSNQPNAAKGKTPITELLEIEHALDKFTQTHGGLIEKAFYCHHHPEGIVPEYTTKCGCRKPGTLFVETAITDYGLDRSRCWFVGDQDTDIFCGQAAGLKTIQIQNAHSQNKSGKSKPDAYTDNLLDAAKKLKEMMV